jgi:hypothetical protein
MSLPTIITPVSEDALEAFLPLERVREACLVSNNRQDTRLRAKRRAAYGEAKRLSRSTLLPETLESRFRVPFKTTTGMGLEPKDMDLDGISVAFRLLSGPVQSVTSIIYQDQSGVDAETIESSRYNLESNAFVRWHKDFVMADAVLRPFIKVTYEAGFADNDPRRVELEDVMTDLIAAMWDGRGGQYNIPSGVRTFLFSLRTSRTFVPGQKS